ncbi:hypothetical protein BJX96DRAFT_177020 [Aspergillus floccosus]
MASTNLSHGMIDPQLLGSTPSMTLPDHGQYKLNVAELVNELLDREQKSVLYRSNLESRIDEESARLQEERKHRVQAEHSLAEWQRSHFQLEASYRWSNDDNEFLRRDLATERKKNQDLESRLTSLSSLHEALQQSAWPVGAMDGRLPQEKSVENCQLLLDNQRQRELIMELQLVNRSHERTINTLETAFQNLLGSLSCCSSYAESDGSATVTEAPIGAVNPPSQHDSQYAAHERCSVSELFEER